MPNTAQTVKLNGRVAFTAYPSAGYQVDGWYLDGDTTAAQTGGKSYLLANVTATHTVQVTFKALAVVPTPTPTPVAQTFNVTPSAGTNGRVAPRFVQKVTANGSVTFTAVPSAGYQVDGWYLDGDAKAAQTGGKSYTLDNVNAAHAVKVTFKALATAPPATPGAQTFTVTPSAGTNGRIAPRTAQQVAANGSVTFTATPKNGFQVDGWYLDGSTTAAQTGGTSYTLTNVTAAHSVQVTFK